MFGLQGGQRSAGRTNPAFTGVTTALRKRGVARAVLLVGLITLVAVLSFAALFIEVVLNSRRMNDYRDRLDHSLETRAAVRRLFSALQDAETGEHGFILTGDPEFLEPYRAAVQSIPDLVERVATLTNGTPRQLKAVQLQERSRELLSLLAETIERYQDVGPAVAVGSVKDKRAKRQMDEIRRLVRDLVAAENREIEEYSAVVRQRTAWFETITFGFVSAIGILTVVASGATTWYVVRRYRSEEALTEASGRAEAASRAKTEFLASMSHEIRTPLNGILGYTDLLLDAELRPEQRRLAERIYFAGSALLTIVNDILDFSKIEAGQIILHREPFLLKGLVDNTVSIVADLAERKGLAMEAELDPNLPPALVGDEGRLRQILLNLLNNAVKFTSEGRVSLSVRRARSGDVPCDMSDQCEFLRFAVSDTGIGIPEDQRKNLFHRFYQVNQSSTREFGGTGLGLAISKRLVQLMGGEIGLNSAEGKGSTFWFTVPLPRAEEAVIAQQLAASMASKPYGPDPASRRSRAQSGSRVHDPQECRSRGGHGRKRGRGRRGDPSQDLRPGAHGRSDARDGRHHRNKKDPRAGRPGQPSANHRHDRQRLSTAGAGVQRSRHGRPYREAIPKGGIVPESEHLAQKGPPSGTSYGCFGRGAWKCRP